MKFNLQAKVLSSFLVVILALAGLGVFTLYEMANLNQDTEHIGLNILPTIEKILLLRVYMNKYRQNQLLHLVVGTAAEKTKVGTDLEANAAEITNLYTELKALAVDSDELALQAASLLAWNSYLEATAPFLALSQAGDLEGAEAVLVGVGGPPFQALVTANSEYQAFNQTEADDAQVDSEATFSNARNLVIAVIVVVTLAALALGYFLARSISSAARQMAAVANGIANGELEHTITLKSRDEMGDMAQAFTRMVASRGYASDGPSSTPT